MFKRIEHINQWLVCDTNLSFFPLVVVSGSSDCSGALCKGLPATFDSIIIIVAPLGFFATAFEDALAVLWQPLPLRRQTVEAPRLLRLAQNVLVVPEIKSNQW